MEMNRRDFLKRASLTAVAVGSTLPLCSAGQESPAPIPIIDTHQHLWDLSRFKLTWLSPPLDRSFVTKDYIEATRGLIFSQRVLLALTEKSLPRPRAYELVQRSSLRVWAGSLGLKELLLSDPDVLAVLSPPEIETCFTLDTYLEKIDYIFERVLGHAS